MVKLLREANLGYSAAVYRDLDEDFKDSDGTLDANYVSDQVELWLYNTEKLEKEIYNNRRKPHSVAYAAMLDLFQDVVNRYEDRKITVTSEMAKQWFKKNGLDYKEILAPVVARIEEDRTDDKKNESLIRETVDDEVRELVLTITNDGDLYTRMIIPTINNLKRKIKRGIYDDALAVKAWQYVADEGVRRYDRDYGSGRGSLTMLDKATRIAIARELKDYYEDEIFEDDVDVFESVSMKESAWMAPDGTRYGKQKRGSRFEYRFTRRELQDMIDRGIAEEIRNAEDAWELSDDVIGISWNDTNGYKSGILFRGKDGNLYVGWSGVANMFL